MAGVYDNEQGCYLQDPGLERGYWFQNDDGLLYIVPNPAFGIQDPVGPGDETEEKLNAAIGGGVFLKANPERIAEDLGLEYVPPGLKRFDPQTGYYVA